MLPEYISLVLQDLGYLALIIIVPCTVYNTVQNLTFGMMLKSHIEIDLLKFERINKDIGRHDSELNDLKTEKMSAIADTFRHLLDGKA